MDSNIQQKLFHYAETPPRSAWEGITAVLDETPAYAQKLYDYEQAPPAGVWEKVARQTSLSQPKVVPFRSNLFKYAIAAAVLVVIGAGSIFYFKHGAGAELATQPQNAVSPDVNKTSSDLQSQPTLATGSGKVAEADVASDQDVSDGIATVSNRGRVLFSPRVRIAPVQRTTGAIAIAPKVKTVIDTELADRYMIATTSGGKVVRLPKKAYSDYACADAKNYQCKQKIASLQSKMAASVATDFTEFMDLLKKLQEAQ